MCAEWCALAYMYALRRSSVSTVASPTLNQIGYMLCMGVLLDCFVTTKVIIPCAMALMPGDGNFWPRKRQKELLTGAQSYNSGLLPEPLGRLASTRGL